MFSRRHFIAGAAATTLAPAILRAQSLWRNYPFSLGVASGDPAPDGFVIWTRIAPEPLAPDGGMGIGVAPVKWEVATDDRFADIVATGEAPARPELAHSVHVEVTGLQPDRPYWYRFEIQGERSIRGRARTLPLPGAAPQTLRFGVAGCQHYEEGYYAAYRHLAREELAFVYHYGDYIYEYGGDALRTSRAGDIIQPVRRYEGRMLFDLDDYRQRYAQTKMDVDLQRAHAAHSFLVTMDDHEVENNWVGNIPEDDVPPEIFQLRRAQAFQAWYEHMPVRRASLPGPHGIRIQDTVRWGNLALIHQLDTRQFRTDQPCNDQWATPCRDVNLPNADVLGAEQEAWLARNLSQGQSRWNVLAQQVMMMSLDRRTRPEEPEKYVNLDSWAGYEVARQRMLARMRGLDNVVVITGDEHQNFAGLLHHRDEPVGVEFVATSVSSGGNGQDVRRGSDVILANNPQLKFINDQRGYLTCEVTNEEWRTNFMVLDRVSSPDGAISKRATWATNRGRPALTQVS
ncbi:MAG: alkaline phosphatase D family protein [Allosphingosinicella sp.]